MKRLIVLLVVCSMVLMMAACGNGGAQPTPAPQDPQTPATPAPGGDTPEAPAAGSTINLWLPAFGTETALDEEIWAPVLEKYEQETGNKVQFTVLPWDGYEEKYLTAIAGKAGPDVGYMYVEMYPAFIQMGAVVDMDPFFTQDEKDQFLDWESGRMMGGQYGLPFIGGDPRVMLYNKDILESLGEQPPVTWEDFRRIAMAATQDTDNDGVIDQWGYSTGFGDSAFGWLSSTFYPFLWQAGGELYNDAGDKVTLNTPEVKRAVQFIYDLIHVDKVVPDDWSSSRVDDMFVNYFGPGKAAFMLAPTSTVETRIMEFPDLKWDYVTALKDKIAMTFSPSDYLTLMAAAPDKEVAVGLMKHFTKVESLERLAEFQPIGVMRKDQPFRGMAEFERALMEDADMARPLPPVLEGFKVYDYLLKNLQMILNDQMSIDDGLAEIDRFGNEAVAEAIAKG